MVPKDRLGDFNESKFRPFYKSKVGFYRFCNYGHYTRLICAVGAGHAAAGQADV
jgi:hypothetical protein